MLLYASIGVVLLAASAAGWVVVLEETSDRARARVTLSELARLARALEPVDVQARLNAPSLTPHAAETALGGNVPFLADGLAFRSPWATAVSIGFYGQRMIVDFPGIGPEACELLMQGAGEVGSVLQVAASGAVADLRTVPVDASQAQSDCAESTFVRFELAYPRSSPS